MCDITTNLQNQLKLKIKNSPNESKNYLKLALNILDNIQLLDGRVFEKIELFKYCIELDDSNPEYFFEMGQHLKYSQVNQVELNNKKILKEIDCYLNSINLIINNHNNIDTNNKSKKQINRYYIALADALVNNNETNNYKSIIETNNDKSNKKLKLNVGNEIKSFDKLNILLEAIDYCPEKTKEYLNFISNFLENNKSIKLLNGKSIKIKKSNNSYNNLFWYSIFLILIIFNIYYLYFKK